MTNDPRFAQIQNSKFKVQKRKIRMQAPNFSYGKLKRFKPRCKALLLEASLLQAPNFSYGVLNA
jgi:hypothetical protein